MYFVEKTGKTKDEAIELALIELDASIDEVEIETLENENKGFLGIFGTKEAKVKVTIKENAPRVAKEFVEKVLESMNIFAKVESQMMDELLHINLIGEDMGILIGKYGQTLDSFQYLISLVVNRHRDKHLRVVLDTENYREKRKEVLESMAYKMAKKAVHLRKDIILEPMNPYERRIIHSALQNNKDVSTMSQGEEPNRKVIIFLKR
jgi:spoIIIJ-associated protein